MNKSKSLKDKVLRVVLFIVCIAIAAGFVFGTIFQNQREDELEKYGRYTIAYVTETYFKPNGNKVARIHYFVDGEKIKFVGHPDYNPEIPGRYYVKFSIKDPKKYKKIDFTSKVPESVQESPPFGWKSIPNKK